MNQDSQLSMRELEGILEIAQMFYSRLSTAEKMLVESVSQKVIAQQLQQREQANEKAPPEGEAQS